MAVVASLNPSRRGISINLWNFAYAGGALALLFAQIATGTSAGFALLVFTFIMLAGVTVRLLGGLFNILGLSVAVLALQQVVISQVAKVFYLQPADSPLLHPIDTMLMYVLGIMGVFLAATAFRALRIDTARSLFRPELEPKRLFFLSIVLTILSMLRFYALARFGVFEGAGGGVYIGGWIGPVRQFTFIPVLAVAFGTASVIISSEGRRCVGFVNFFAIGAPIIAGILSAIRSDTASAFVTFILTCLAFQFKFRFFHFVVAAIAFYFFQFIMFPYALYGRGEGEVRIGKFEQRIEKSLQILGDVIVNPGKYKEKVESVSATERYEFTRMRYFGPRLPTLDRYAMIIVNDQVVDAVYLKGTTGFTTIDAGVNMLIPRFLNPDKQAFGTSNWIARRAKGLVNEEDEYTQITLSFMADAFMCFKWGGVLGISFLISFLYFTVYHLVFGSSMWRNAYPVALAFLTTWVFSEGTIQAQILNIIQYPLFFVIVVLPLLIIASSVTRKRREAPPIYASGRPSVSAK